MLAGIVAVFILGMGGASAMETIIVPEIEGGWWRVASNPDLGAYTRKEQEPVDFALWQAADGTWQLWSCIRHTGCGGHTRLFHRWEGQRLTDPDWKPMGIVMEARQDLGETPGGLQAPHVIRQDGVYHMAYGDWENICFAVSEDGKTFERVVRGNGKTGIFSERPGGGARDPMLIRIDGLWHCYYTANPRLEGAIYCRTSLDLAQWSPSFIVCCGGRIGRNAWWAECPHVVEAAPGEFVLFRNQFYGEGACNYAYYSRNPRNFGVDCDAGRVARLPAAAPEIVRDEDRYYVAALTPKLDGIRVARLRWARRPFLGDAVLPMQTQADGGVWKVLEGALPIFFTNARREFIAPHTPFFISTGAAANGGWDDAAQGVIVSEAFPITEAHYELLISGGNDPVRLHVAIIAEETGEEFARYTGRNSAALEKEFWDASAHVGRTARIRIVDRSSGPWGHINFGGLFTVPPPLEIL